MDKSMAGIHEERKSEGVFQNSLETLRSVSATLGGLYPSSRRRLSSPCPPSNSPLASYVSVCLCLLYNSRFQLYLCISTSFCHTVSVPLSVYLLYISASHLSVSVLISFCMSPDVWVSVFPRSPCPSLCISIPLPLTHFLASCLCATLSVPCHWPCLLPL